MKKKNLTPANEREKLLIAKIFRYLVRTIHEDTDLKTIAHACGTKQNFLRERFITICNGQTIADIKRKIRLLQTVKTMMRTNAQLKEVSGDADYSSPASFDRAFKNTFGITPQEYIAKMKMRSRKNGN